MNFKSMMKDWKKYLAEMLGTLILVLVGLGASLFASAHLGPLAAALGFGLTLMALVFIIGPISGCHVNPAVSLGFAIRKKLSWKDFGFYVLAQIIGAIVGVAIVFGVYKLFTTGTGSPFAVAKTYSDATAMGTNTTAGLFLCLLVDIAMTFVFVLTIMGVVRKIDNKAVAGVVIGLILTALLLTTATINPAINFANAIFTSGKTAISQVWLFLVGPLAGGALAAVVGWLLFRGEDRKEVGTENAPKIADVKPEASKK